MFPVSQANTITEQAYRKAVLHSNRMRKERTTQKLDYFHDEQGPYIMEQLRRIYTKSADKVQPVSVNIVKKIINLKSTVYLQDATRFIQGTDQDKQIYAEIETTANLPVTMKLANKYTSLLGNVLLRPVWRGSRMELDVLTGNVLDVVTGDSPQDIRAVIVEHFSQNGRADEITYSAWTPEEVRTLDYAGNVIATEPNPYGILPFVPIWNTPAQGDFWLSGAEDLILIQDAVNRSLSDLCRTLGFQAFSVAVMRGVSMKEHQGVTIDPGAVLALENKDSGFDFKSPDAPISEVLDTVDRLIKWAALTNGLSASSVNTEIVEESGVSKIVGNAELEEIRRDQIANFASVEDQLFQMFRTVWNVHNPQRKISEGVTLRVDFYDPRPASSLSERVQEIQALAELGLFSPIDFLMEQNPDLDRDMAKAKLLQIRDDLKEFPIN